MEIISLIISLISGAAGGNIVGALSKDKNLGPVINSIVGLLGGGLGDFILRALGVFATTQAPAATGGSEYDISTLLANIGVSGASGAALTAIITLIKDAMNKR